MQLASYSLIAVSQIRNCWHSLTASYTSYEKGSTTTIHDIAPGFREARQVSWACCMHWQSAIAIYLLVRTRGELAVALTSVATIATAAIERIGLARSLVT